jgi:F-type H+-transporting ATPase subunit alpha
MNDNSTSPLEAMHEEEKNSGTVLSSLDGYIIASGLYSVFIGEKVIVNYKVQGIAFEIGADYTIIFLLEQVTVPIGAKVERTYTPFSIGVSDALLGRTINIFGQTIDGLPDKTTQENEVCPIEREIPNITERTPIDTPLATGFLVIDSLIPIGKGQRQLFIGNQHTGKTYTAINAFIRNKNNKNVVCIYVTIGQQQLKTAKIKEYLNKYNALDNTIIVNSSAGEPAINNYLAPYVGITIAEYFAHQKKKT